MARAPRRPREELRWPRQTMRRCFGVVWLPRFMKRSCQPLPHPRLHESGRSRSNGRLLCFGSPAPLSVQLRLAVCGAALDLWGGAVIWDWMAEGRIPRCKEASRISTSRFNPQRIRWIPSHPGSPCKLIVRGVAFNLLVNALENGSPRSLKTALPVRIRPARPKCEAEATVGPSNRSGPRRPQVRLSGPDAQPGYLVIDGLFTCQVVIDSWVARGQIFSMTLRP